MAVIGNQVPPPAPLPEEYKTSYSTAAASSSSRAAESLGRKG